MKGKSKIRVGIGACWTRFENLHRSEFNNVVDIFCEAFPSATWDQDRGGWLLPTSSLAEVIRLNHQLFGSTGVVIEDI